MKMKLRELLQLKNEKLELARNAINDGNMSEFEMLEKEIFEIQNKIDGIKKLETYDKEISDKKDITGEFKESSVQAIVNYIRTGVVNAAGPLKESTGENGGFLVPEDIRTTINEYKRSFVSLKDFVRVEKVSVPEGQRTYEKTANLTPLANITEMGEIPEVDGALFERINYKVKDFGGILPVSNTLLKDTPENLIAYLARWFGKKAIVTENSEILKVLKTITPTDITTVDEIKDAVNVKLDPLFVPGAKVITNQSGFNVLDKIKDKDGNYVMQPLITDTTKKALFGKFEVVVIADTFLSGSTGSKFPLYIGHLEEAVTFFDLETLDIKATDVGGKAFTRNSYDTRMIERFDVKAIDKAAVVVLEITKNLALVPSV